MKYLLDTNVYHGAAGSEERAAGFGATFFPLLPSTYLSAVVAYELLVDAQGRQTRDLVEAFVAPTRRAGRIVSPVFEDWTAAASILTTISERAPSWRTKLRGLLNDVLIALCARRIGATLFTYNARDFRLIRRHYEFSLRVLS